MQRDQLSSVEREKDQLTASQSSLTLMTLFQFSGAPIPGGGKSGDVWRGNTTAPTYASYAAQAWLASEESPITFVRLSGEQHSATCRRCW